MQKSFSASTFRHAVLPIIQGLSQLSLRDLEQFVTRHAAATPIEYYCNGKFVQLFELYKSCVKANEKKNCDPFRRYNRIHIDCGIGSAVETTIGQLKFMHFAIDNGVITFAQSRFDREQSDELVRRQQQSQQRRIVRPPVRRRAPLATPSQLDSNWFVHDKRSNGSFVQV